MKQVHIEPIHQNPFGRHGLIILKKRDCGLKAIRRSYSELIRFYGLDEWSDISYDEDDAGILKKMPPIEEVGRDIRWRLFRSWG